jgi:mono/diheme cytochrome c family protein
MKKVFGLISISLIGGMAFILSGSYNVSATNKHWDITTKLLEIARDKSVHNASKDIVVPDLDNIEMISNGAKNYDSMCVQCHLAPGAPNTELHQALYPKPPVFYGTNDEHEHKHSPAETFWVIKNGFKMTGMPAWGEFHTDQQLWEMTAFLQKMENMTATRYFELVGEGGHSHSDGVHFEATPATKSGAKDVNHGVKSKHGQ